jgi:Ion transport protein
MHEAASIRGFDLIHGEGIESPIAAMFFVIGVIIGNFFLMNQFVGVIISTYNREKELMGKDFTLSEEQKKWKKDRLMILQIQPKHRMNVPREDWRQPFFYIAEAWLIQYFIQLCIVLNTIILTL